MKTSGPGDRGERRQRTRRRVDESVEWFRTLAESTSTAIFVYRERFLYVNPASIEITGYSRDELLDSEFWRMVHPDHREMIRSRGERRLRGEPVPNRYEFKILRKDGGERWLDFTSSVIQFEGAPAGLGTAFDVTERREALRRLAESEERLRLAQRAAGIVPWDWDLATDCLIASEFAEELFGMKPEEICPTSEAFLRLVHPDDRERFAAEAREAVRSGEGLSSEIRIQTPNGARWLLERAQIWRDGSGRARRVIGAAVDVTARKQMELALRASEETHRRVVEHQTELVARLDPEGRLDFVSPAFCRFFGGEEKDLLGRQAPFLDGGALAAVYARLAAPPHTSSVELRTPSRSGWRWISWSFAAVMAPAGALQQVVAVGRDVTERRIAEEALFEEKERAQVTLAAIGEAVVRTDAASRIDYLNPAAERLTGWRLAETYGRPAGEVLRLLDPRSDQPIFDPLAACLGEGRRVDLPQESRLVDRAGERHLVRVSASPLRDRTGALRGAVLVLEDLTRLRTMEDEVRHLETHDPLTGFWNRRAFEDVLEAAAAEARHGGDGALLYLDLHSFKLINETCGHVAGDELLRKAAALIVDGAAPGELAARLGGDDFAILVPGAVERARARAEVLRQRFGEFRFTWEDHSFAVPASIGLVPLATSGPDLPGLLAAADAACQLAKEEGRGRVHEHRVGDRQLATRYGELQWVQRIHRAFDEDRFVLYCQSIVPLPHAPGLPPLSEVLVRMRAEDGEIVPASAFIPAAERYHLIELVDRWVVGHTFAVVARNREGTTFALNISGQSLGDETFLPHVLAELDRSGADPSRLCFEVTETAAVANLSAARRFIAVLKARGCRFVLDDFGSGMSSFAYLKNLPVDFLKIDGGFVRQMDRDPMRRVLVESIHQIGHALGIQTVAESVETEEVLRDLDRIGVDYAQGYYLGRPEPLGE